MKTSAQNPGKSRPSRRLHGGPCARLERGADRARPDNAAPETSPNPLLLRLSPPSLASSDPPARLRCLTARSPQRADARGDRSPLSTSGSLRHPAPHRPARRPPQPVQRPPGSSAHEHRIEARTGRRPGGVLADLIRTDHGDAPSLARRSFRERPPASLARAPTTSASRAAAPSAAPASPTIPSTSAPSLPSSSPRTSRNPPP